MDADYEEKYHRVESIHWWFVARRNMLCALVRQFAPGPDSPILDLGCSGGVTLQALGAAGFTEVDGLDISPQALAQCRDSGLTRIFLMDAAAPMLPPEAYDLVLASDVLEHLADDGQALKSWFRLLRPGGVLIVFVPAFMFLWSPHDRINRHYRRYRLGELAAKLGAAGFQNERRSYWSFLIFPPAVLLRALQRLLPPIQGLHHLEVRTPPGVLNRFLVRLLRVEDRLVRAGVRWPWGQSALVIARKPGTSP